MNLFISTPELLTPHYSILRTYTPIPPNKTSYKVPSVLRTQQTAKLATRVTLICRYRIQVRNPHVGPEELRFVRVTLAYDYM